MKTLLAALLIASCIATAPALAHKPSDSYLTLEPTAYGVQGHWDVALRDLDRAFAVDADGDGALTWRELHVREQTLANDVFAQLGFARGAACVLESAELGIVEHSDGRYARFPFTARCPGQTRDIAVRYDFFFTLDPQHRAVVRVLRGDAEQTEVLTAAHRTFALDTSGTSAETGALSLLRQGVEHILTGYDHILFLLALLLPAVMRRSESKAPLAEQVSAVVRDVVKIVTAFTVAHSLTLALSALGMVSMSADIIEPAIAASVVLAALDNLYPMFGEDRWSIAFVLGLLHGFGFSSALSDLGLTGGALVRGLCAFNVGVELGQLAIVAVFVPVAFALCRRPTPRVAVLRGGSLAIAALSLVWFVERVRGG